MSSRVVNISSRAYSSRVRLDSLTFRVELELDSRLLESSFDRVLIESNPSSLRVVSFY